MTRRLYFITHGEVLIDPDVPVPDWPLSEIGRQRHAVAAGADYIRGVTAIHSSDERKAKDGAGILADALGLPVTVTHDLHENDRSATGYLPKAEFEAVADAFFAHPDRSMRGWETARDAQARIVRAVQGIVARDSGPGDIAIVAHGGVGALLLAHVRGEPISRRLDQPGGGGGNRLTLGLPDLTLIDGWRPIEDGGRA
ncbi:MAG: phosphoglycerate mutase family protein [Marinibacterium sp.]|nr:phosphoglycerate mutase family protein [Marinibacterium sp.]